MCHAVTPREVPTLNTGEELWPGAHTQSQAADSWIEGALLLKQYTVHWRAGYGEKKFAAVIPVLSVSNNVPKPKNIDFQISTWRNGDLDEILKLLVDI